MALRASPFSPFVWWALIQPGDGGCRSEPNVLFVCPAARRRLPPRIRRLVISQHDCPVDRHDVVVLPFLADYCYPLLGRLLRASVGSTEASNGRLARFSRIDRSSREATSPVGVVLNVCHQRPMNGYQSRPFITENGYLQKPARTGYNR